MTDQPDQGVTVTPTTEEQAVARTQGDVDDRPLDDPDQGVTVTPTPPEVRAGPRNDRSA